MSTGRLRLIAYSPYWRVSWSQTWQEGKRAPLTRDLPAIVKAIERGAVKLVDLLAEAERQEEIERQARLAEEVKRRQEEDRRQIQQSNKDSHAQLRSIIQTWGDVESIERFFRGVQDSAAALPAEKKNVILERLKLAREFISTQDPLDFFLSWRTPLERYHPLATRSVSECHEEGDGLGHLDS